MWSRRIKVSGPLRLSASVHSVQVFFKCIACIFDHWNRELKLFKVLKDLNNNSASLWLWSKITQYQYHNWSTDSLPRELILNVKGQLNFNEGKSFLLPGEDWSVVHSLPGTLAGRPGLVGLLVKNSKLASRLLTCPHPQHVTPCLPNRPWKL